MTLTCTALLLKEFSYNFSIAEDSVTGTFIGAVRAIDSDEGLNGQFDYRFDSSTHLPFAINGSTGEIFVAGVVDYEDASSWSITVVATDYGFSPKSGLASVTIHIVDANDNPPHFIPDSETIEVELEHCLLRQCVVQISEDTLVTSVVYAPLVVDRDGPPNAESRFSLQDSTLGHSTFAVNSETGKVFLTSPLVAEGADRHSLTIWARNRQPPHYNASLQLNVWIRRRRRIQPVFEKHHETYYVSSKSPIGTTIGRLPIIQPTSSDGSSVAFYIENNDLVDVDRLSGRLTLKSAVTALSITVEVIAVSSVHLSHVPPDRYVERQVGLNARDDSDASSKCACKTVYRQRRPSHTRQMKQSWTPNSRMA